MENKGKIFIRDSADDYAISNFLSGREIGRIVLMAVGSAIGSL